MQRVFNAAAENPLMIPTDLMSYVVDYVQTSRLSIPIGQVFGFTPYKNQIADNITTTASAASAAASAAALVVVSLATSAGLSGSSASSSGPSVTGLGAGSYVVLAGMTGQSDFGSGSCTLTTSGGMVVSGAPASSLDIARGSVPNSYRRRNDLLDPCRVFWRGQLRH
jgi:hypothetical protein